MAFLLATTDFQWEETNGYKTEKMEKVNICSWRTAVEQGRHCAASIDYDIPSANQLTEARPGSEVAKLQTRENQ